MLFCCWIDFAAVQHWHDQDSKLLSCFMCCEVAFKTVAAAKQQKSSGWQNFQFFKGSLSFNYHISVLTLKGVLSWIFSGLGTFQSSCNVSLLPAYTNKFYVKPDRISVWLSQKSDSSGEGYLQWTWEAQYNRKYDRFCKLTTRKIIQKKMSIGVHNPLRDFFIQFFFLHIGMDLNSRNNMAYITLTCMYCIKYCSQRKSHVYERIRLASQFSGFD